MQPVDSARRRFVRGLLPAVLCGALSAPSCFAAELPDTVQRIKPSIVGVGTYAALRRPSAALLGTGFVIGDGSLVATNHHVASVEAAGSRDGKEELVVFVGHGRDVEYRHSEIVATDAEHDLALLKLIGPPLPALALGSDSAAREGEAIAFTGYPIGAVLGLYPVTHQGIIAAITPIAVPAHTARELTASKIAALRDPYAVLQLDATAYPGNSGSPVYDQAQGRVLGVISQVFVKGRKEDVLKDPSGITYAIPVRYLRALLDRR